MALATIRHFENLFVQHRLGSLDQAQWAGYKRLFRFYLDMHGFKVWWSDPGHQKWFSPSFKQMVDDM